MRQDKTNLISLRLRPHAVHSHYRFDQAAYKSKLMYSRTGGTITHNKKHLTIKFPLKALCFIITQHQKKPHSMREKK